MKRWNKLFYAFLSVFFIVVLGAMPANAAEESLTLKYDQNGVQFDIYRVAQRMEDGRLVLTGDFAEYPVALPGDDWLDTAATLAGLAVRDALPPVSSAVVCDGSASFQSLEEGLYLVLGEAVVREGYRYTPVPFLVEISDEPVTAMVKFDQEKDDGTISYAVEKVWKGDNSLNRPKQVTIQLLRDGKVYDAVELNPENGWQYTWQQLEKGHRWQVTEKETTEEYTVLVSQSGQTFTITNTFVPQDNPDAEESKGERPQTGDSRQSEILLLGGSAALILSGIVNRRKTKHS